MTVSRERARQLCTQRELELVEASWGAELRGLSRAELARKVQRTRTQRDKFRDLARQQAGEARGKRDPRSTRASRSNRNTELKAQLFDEALQRFEERLAEMEEGPDEA
jgi:Spy/CpxP family protein refolding chaperone